jgi:hypothetical protein
MFLLPKVVYPPVVLVCGPTHTHTNRPCFSTHVTHRDRAPAPSAPTYAARPRATATRATACARRPRPRCRPVHRDLRRVALCHPVIL